jgi:hypothetical protein
MAASSPLGGEGPSKQFVNHCLFDKWSGVLLFHEWMSVIGRPPADFCYCHFLCLLIRTFCSLILNEVFEVLRSKASQRTLPQRDAQLAQMAKTARRVSYLRNMDKKLLSHAVNIWDAISVQPARLVCLYTTSRRLLFPHQTIRKCCEQLQKLERCWIWSSRMPFWRGRGRG